MKYKNRTLKVGLLLAFLFLFALGQNAMAQTNTWTGATDNDWNTGTNWSLGVPTTLHDVVIPTGATITTSGAVNAKSISINGTSTLTITQATNIATAGTGAITLNSTSSVIIDAAVAVAIGSTTYRGNIVMNDNSTFTTTAAADITLSGTWTKSDDATITLNAATIFSFVGTTALSLPSTVNSFATLTVNKVGSTVTLNGDLTTTGNVTITNGTLIVGNYDLSIGGVTDIDAGATLNASATETVTRAIAAVTNLDGTIILSGSNVTNTLSGAITFGATGVLNLNNSTTTISAAPVFAAGCTINALGTDLTYSGNALDFANSTINTNSNTNLTLSAIGALTNFPTHINNLKDLSITTAQVLTLTANLTLAGNLTVSDNGLATGANILTVYGILDLTGGTFDASAAGAKLVLYGPIDNWGTITNFANLDLTIAGSGNITPANLPAAVTALNDVVMNRIGANLGFAAGATLNSLVVTSGTVTANTGAAFVITTTTSIGTNGTLNTNGASSSTFTTSVIGDGTIIATNADDELIFLDAFSFTGDLQTGTGTILRFTTAGGDVSLPASVTNLDIMEINNSRKITLNNNLRFSTAISAAEFVSGELDVNGYTLTFMGTYTDAGAAWTLTAYNSTLIFAGAATTVAAATYNIDETTNIDFQAIPTLSNNITKCKNLTMSANVTLVVAFEVYGNLTIFNGVSFFLSGFALTVYGDASVSSGSTLNATATTVTLYGSLQGEGTYTTDASSNFIIKGTGSQLVLPYSFGATSIGNLTINRPSGVKLNRNLTIGAAGTTGILTLTNGDLDLNGYVLTLARTGAATALIVETPGNTIINTGASGALNGYVTLTSTDLTDIEPSGIGVLLATGGGATTVRRYPLTVPVPNVGLSTSRIFYINNAVAISALTLQYDNTELYSSASDLEVYMSANPAFSSYTNVSDETGVTTTSNINTPVSGKGNVAVTGTVAVITATARYFALAALPGDGGVMRTFAASSGNWGEAANWTPNGIPSKVDQVVIGASTVYLNGNGNIYECKVLNMNHAQAELKPTNNTINGDNVSLRVMGNITVAAGAEILGVNGYGRLSLIIGDGTTAGVSSTITTNNSYVPTSGIWIHNLTINMAEVNSTSSNEIRISGNVSLMNNTYFNVNHATNTPTLVFWGGYGNQAISIPISAAAVFNTLKFDNNAYVTTTSSFDVTNQFTVKNGSSFIAQNGVITFPTTSTKAWEVENGGILKLWNVVFNDNMAAAYSPSGDAYIQGDFTKSGSSDFTQSSGTVIFSNTTQREIINAGTGNLLHFNKLQISENSSVVTSTSWEVASEIDVKNNASLKADNGTINFTNNGWIKNVSTHTLEFFNLDISNNALVQTNDSWTIKGNLTLGGVNAQLLANNGTITFDNFQEKTINTGGGTLRFFKLLVTNGSKLTTDATNGDFTIANSGTYQNGAGIDVQGTGQFYVGDPAIITTFDIIGAGVSAGYPKTITKSSSGVMKFGQIVITAKPNNEVSTSSDFTITGTGASTFSNEGAGGKFTATAGTVTFNGTAPQIESVSPAVTQFYNLRGIDDADITFPATTQEIKIAGDLILNDQSTIAPGGINSKVIFNGSGTQYIKGTSIALNPVSFADLQINKPNNSEVILDIDVEIADNANHELTLTNGILNLGNKTFTVNAGIISRHNGVINGATGTYVINGNHETPKLEDAYFTVNGTPTLYNLTVNVAHETANDLTVNGTLHLIGNLTIASGVDANNPKLLTLNGNLTRTNGLILGSPTNSRLVLAGTGTVANGLSNVYFTNPVSATTVQLEIARQETLGGNLTIVDDSHLRINTGINDFNLGTNTLEFATNSSILTMISGGIKAGTGSTVNLTDAITYIPPSMFRNEECYNLTYGANLTLGGNLKVNGTLNFGTGYDIITNDNILTLGPSSTLPAFSSTAHIVGNLRRYVKNIPPTVFNIGGSGTAIKYTPITLQFANTTTAQPILIKPTYLDPTDGRGGDPKYCADVYFEIIPEGTAPVDSLKAIFQWAANIDGGTTASANASFPAKWTGSSWYDYRNKLQSFTVTDPRIITMTSFPIANPAALNGVWAIFNASANTTEAKDRAIATNRNRLVITKVTPTPVKLDIPFKTTVQLQNQYGQPIKATEAFELQIQKAQGNGTADFPGVGHTVVGIIQPGQSEVTISGMTFTGGTNGNNFVLKADTTGGSLNWQIGISEPFAVIPATPTEQSSNIVFSNVKSTSMSIAWGAATGTGKLVVMKADTLLREDEFPVNATTYLANTIYGAGSTFGNAVVVYNGPNQQVDVTGLAPNTTYYVYVFNYDGGAGSESYRTTAAALNPNAQATTGSYDDDVAYGINNTRALSKAIGTNTPVRGTVKSDTDEDWFNFTMTSASPNLRIKLYNLPENYNIELYDQTGKRVRRSYLQNKYVDAFIMNELSAGTYTVRVYGYNGLFDVVNPYTLQVTTSSSEIFSVTP